MVCRFSYKCNLISDTKKLHQCITALIFVSNSGIDHSQHVSDFAAATSPGIMLSDSSTNDQFSAAETYTQMESVVKHCITGSSTIIGDTLDRNYCRTLNDRDRSEDGNKPIDEKGKFCFKKPSMSLLKKIFRSGEEIYTWEGQSCIK